MRSPIGFDTHTERKNMPWWCIEYLNQCHNSNLSRMLTSHDINIIFGIDVRWQVHEYYMKNKSEVSIHIHNGQKLNVYSNEN